MQLTSIRTEGDSIEIIDQLVLPHTISWISIESPQGAYEAIKSMKIRGAPAIASLAALSIASYLSRATKQTPTPAFLDSLGSLEAHLTPIFDHLYSSRPTAVNLGGAIARLRGVLASAKEKQTSSAAYDAADGAAAAHSSVESVVQGLIAEGRAVADEDVGRNKTMGRIGADWILDNAQKNGFDTSNGLNVLTVCNTGSLATSGYGTALGIITHLHEVGKLRRAYYTQSTPYHQGSRLTALELKTLQIPSTMICDSMVGSLFQHESIHAVVVGADRVAKNGDTANKIGTYNAAVIAKRHRVPFVVCCPVSTLDLSIPDGSAIPIEYRPPIEACLVRGRIVSREGGGGIEEAAQAIVQITPDLALEDHGVFNPSFDVTPSELIAAIVTEKGVAERAPQATSISVSEVS
ncbi:S-methyl-5-thioribose-1-phosphate isomerase [Serendipita sp. 401]|nr:S-methyl-5-thioribose-1-phosphate isomerase [Serendipita sp. 401]